ncbi:hypothetical protein G3I40_13765 [Streptomyces sp. SID14478]|uniref:hypothetical protein n=1 Tax=Streptomyces sp. SID14478 TaxID=2706073 RepID=UPI0013DB6FFB|nr:hypothetical protein [Streptomyces sp. SID14478]NEB76280.1 hypothetical protein [Streptomyces sp. SID14478]
MQILDIVKNVAVIGACLSVVSAITVAVVTSRANRRLEERKRIAQLATDAFLDSWKALVEIGTCENLLSELRPNAPTERREELESRLRTAKPLWTSAKVRMSLYGGREVSRLVAKIEVAGGFDAGDSEKVYDLACIFLQVRKDLGLNEEIDPVHIFQALVGDRVSLPPHVGARGAIPPTSE